MPELILLRHGQSQWNLENRFTGWIDVDLSDLGREEARQAGEKLRDRKIDRVYTSVLKRAIDTAKIALEAAGKGDMELIQDQALNERHYGDLQGLNKAETAEKFGDEQVHIWRRSFDIAPPAGESLEMTMERVMPYYNAQILPDLLAGKNVMVVAHGNSLRSLMYYLDNHTKESILKLEIPTGRPILYDLDVSGGQVNVVSKREL
jgi:2,3-bisphosphoglycerate-dependent phosphoglycerate mutase